MKNESLTVGIHLDQIKSLSPGIGLLSVTIRARAVLIVIAIGARTNRRDSLTVKITPLISTGIGLLSVTIRARAVLIVIAIGARTNRRDSLTVKITP